MLTNVSQLYPQTQIVLDIAFYNWSSFDQYFKLQCLTNFGVAGQQFLTKSIVPLKPIPLIPTRQS